MSRSGLEHLYSLLREATRLRQRGSVSQQHLYVTLNEYIEVFHIGSVYYGLVHQGCLRVQEHVLVGPTESGVFQDVCD